MSSLDRVAPTPLGETIIHILAAGIAAQIVFEILALLIAPLVLGLPMLPANFVVALTALAGLSLPISAGWAGHLLAGIVVFPVGYMLMRRFLNNWGWALAGALYGIVLWFIAQGFLAPLVGRPFMLGFVSYTWVSLVAHLIYALTIAYVIDRLQRRL
ncbi:DUF6789 family protein [Fodinicurvata sp. EGI_FJ10296]|uniref:DUF6789 family protein n=1 Tax=Fodinicurvata sp. EGI_FJ10296 TaxID=3231908 RepID=UPI003456FE1D